MNSSASFLFATLFFAVIFPYFHAPPCKGATIEGIVLSSGGPVTAPRVRAFSDFAALTSDSPAFVSEQTEKPGQYRMEISPGAYFFTATGKQGETEFFSYHGVNPITIKEDTRWLPFFAVPKKTATCSESKVSGIGGQVMYKGAVLDGGAVSAYSVLDKHFRGMGLLTNSLDAEGRFWFDLEPGSYVIIARHRKNDTEMGPLRKGDLFCYPAANPLTVALHQACDVTLDCYPRDALGDFLGPDAPDPRGRKEIQRRMASLHKKNMYDVEGVPDSLGHSKPAVISGKVVDLQGVTKPGLYVSAYPSDNSPLFQMHVIRLITRSIGRVDEQGHFRLELPAGSYYLVAREKMGEAPDQNELYGLYEGNANHSIEVGAGKTTNDIMIVVAPIMP